MPESFIADYIALTNIVRHAFTLSIHEGFCMLRCDKLRGEVVRSLVKLLRKPLLDLQSRFALRMNPSVLTDAKYEKD